MKTKTVVLILVVLFLISPSSLSAYMAKVTPSPKPVEVNSFEIFWPIVAGKVKGDSLYDLKRTKEKVRGFLIFSNFKKAEYSTVLSQKRLLEYEKLILINKDNDNATKTLNELKDTHNLILDYIDQTKKEGMDVSYLSKSTLAVFDKELVLMKSLSTKVEDSQKQLLSEVVKNLSSIMSKI